MRKFTYCLVLLCLFGWQQLSAQQKKRAERKMPDKVQTLPVTNGYGTAVRPVRQQVIARRNPGVKSHNKNLRKITGLQTLQLPTVSGARNSLPQHFRLNIYRPQTSAANISNRPLAICDTITLTRQSQIDSFPLLYPGCSTIKILRIEGENASPAITKLDSLYQITEITQDLEIKNTSLDSLRGLHNITRIANYFSFWNDNTITKIRFDHLTELHGIVFFNLNALTDMNGLFSSMNNTDMWSVLYINTALPSLNAMSNIQSMFNLSVIGFPNLTSLQGLQNINSCNGGVQIINNPLLADISQLNQLTDLSNGTIDIRSNQQLASLNGLQNITQVGGVVILEGNDQLTNLSEFNNNLVVSNTINTTDTLSIQYNYSLVLCSVPFLCNYLATDTAWISNNAPGCESVAAIRSSCFNCSVIDTVTWNGNISNDWNDTANWTPAVVPGNCTRVVITSGVPFVPVANANITIGGLDMQNGAELDMSNHNLVVKNNALVENSSIYSVQQFTLQSNYQPKVNGSYIQGNFSCLDYGGQSEFLSNVIEGNFILSDSVGRLASSTAFFNSVNGNMTLTNNSDYGQNYLSNASPYYDYIQGDLTVVNNSASWISVGLGGGQPLKLNGSFIVNNNNSGGVDVNNLTFVGNNNVHITQLGTEPIAISNLFMDKFGGGDVILDQDVIVRNSLNFSSNGGFIRTATNKMLVLNDNCVSNPAGGSCVVGPMKKIGNDAFIFPLGDIQNNTIWQAPLTISAPSSVTDEFVAQYIHRNPGADGYDTSQYSPGFGGIAGREYWVLNRTSGASDVTVSLSYDSLRSGPAYLFNDLRVAGWNGSQWTNWSTSGNLGSIIAGTVVSGSALTSYGPLALSYKPIRRPVITIGQVDTLHCVGTFFKVKYTLDTLMLAGNVFKVEVSDTLGNFNNFFNPTIGSITSIQSDSITVQMPFYLVEGKQYKIRIVGNLPSDTSVNTATIISRRPPQLGFNMIGADTVCIGGGIYKYYPDAHEANANFAWSLSGGGSVSTLADSAFINWNTAGTYNLLLSSSNNCGSGPQRAKTILVRPAAPSAASTINKIGRWIYASAPAPAQNATGYRWYRNNILISGATGSSYYASLAGSYSVKYYNFCGEGPASNTISYAANSIPQTISFTAVPDKIFTDAPFTLDASSSSGLPVLLNIISGPGSISGSTYTITATGNVSIAASQAGDDIYDTAAIVTRNFVVNKAPQSINFPAIPDQIYGTNYVDLNATASSGLQVSYAMVSGPAYISGNQLVLTGLGTVTVTASQPGNSNFLAATTVTQSFCIRVAELNTISGAPFVCPGQTTTYTINNINGLTYNWRLSDGTVLSSNTNSVNITWGASGNYTLIVSATGPCGPSSANDSLTVNVVTAVLPGAASNMLPADGATGVSLPLNFSWIPGSNALTYDLYVWDSALAQPATPFAANISGVSYSIPNGALQYNKTYKWTLVSKNACLQTNGPVQRFRLRPLPDLMVTNVQAPASAFSGQTISLNWTVKNIGPGNTTTNQNWTDAVFLSFDSIPAFNIAPATGAGAWSQLDFPVRPLLLAAKPNVSALDSGQQYSNSVNFTLPVNYSQPLYVYVITNYPAGNNAPLQMSVANDTARAPQPVIVTLSPTPDLRVDTVFTPSSAFSGSTINLTYKVKNYGALTPASSVWADKAYISSSPVFNINTAVPLNLRRSNDTYYPNAPEAIALHSAQLQPDSFYTKNMEVVLPNFIFGNYFIYVVTNYSNSLYEGALAGNNTNNALMQVFLTPTPVLTVNTLTLPLQTASVTQPISASWNIFNAGFNNNIEKNKGHYYLNAAPNTCAVGSFLIRDSAGFGSSYWIDRVYLSTDSSSLNINNATLVGEAQHGSVSSSLFADNAEAFKCVINGSLASAFNINTAEVIRPGSSHPMNYNFVLPSNLQAGNYYVYVLANATKTVYEYPGTPQVKRSALPIAIQRPDLQVSAVNIPATVSGAQSFNINYTVSNNGPGTVFNAFRYDRVYVSTSPVFNGSAQLVRTENFTEDIASGTQVSHVSNYAFPAGTSGTRYVYVFANSDSSFRETNMANNISPAAAINVTAASPADLQITSIQLSDTVTTVFPQLIKYTVQNNGAVALSSSWVDSIYISCNSSYDPQTAYYITSITQNRQLAAGASYTDSVYLGLPMSFYINSCFPRANSSNGYFYIKTNADNRVYEGSNTANNTSGSGVRVIVNPLVDHEMLTVTAPDTLTVARPFTASWTVRNKGNKPAGIYYSSWYDAFYFSVDSSFGAGDIFSGSFLINSLLSNNQTYTESRTLTTPNIATGDYYVFAVNDPYRMIAGEIETSNNNNAVRNVNGSAKKIHVIQPLLPDLTDTIIGAPATVAVGQPLTVIQTIRNNGAGPTYPNGWSNDLWLSSDFIPGNAGDIRIAAKNRVGVLQPGQSYNDTSVVYLNINMTPGNYVLIANVDAGNAIFETNDSNNLAFRYITVYVPAAADLQVTKVMKPDTVLLGYTMDSISWIVRNASSNTASGVSSDGVYFSKSSVLDSAATLIAVQAKNINMGPLSNDTVTVRPVLNNLAEGNYNVIVKTDLLNNIVESDKTNNTGVATTQVYVKVKELQLNIAENNTLQNQNRFYKLRVPDSLRGSTILVMLKTNDSLTMRNEIFIGGGYVPDASHFDYRFENANYGNQQIVMTSVTDSVYYINIRCVSVNPLLQNITLKAVKLPFAILSVQSNSGGNIGNVTIKLSGSLFINGMQARLRKTGTTIYASSVYYTNSTVVYATFNLQGKPLGVYDVALIKPDSSVAQLSASFSIVNANNGGLITGGGNNTGQNGDPNAPGCDPGAAAGFNSQLVTEMVIPDKVFAGWAFPIQINYNNPSNSDVPAQVRILYNDKGIVLAKSAPEFSAGNTSLYLELTENGGPPGIIRAGGSGTITVYGKAPLNIAGHTIVYFNLK